MSSRVERRSLCGDSQTARPGCSAGSVTDGTLDERAQRAVRTQPPGAAILRRPAREAGLQRGCRSAGARSPRPLQPPCKRDAGRASREDHLPTEGLSSRPRSSPLPLGRTSASVSSSTRRESHRPPRKRSGSIPFARRAIVPGPDRRGRPRRSVADLRAGSRGAITGRQVAQGHRHRVRPVVFSGSGGEAVLLTVHLEVAPHGVALHRPTA